MARISNFIGNPFYRTSYINGKILRSTGQSYASNLLSNLSTKNPTLTRKIFSNFIDTKNNATSQNVQKALEDYNKKSADEKISVRDKDVGKVLANYFSSSTPLYNGKSSLITDYYSTIGSLYNFLL